MSKKLEILESDFYDREPVIVASDLLGKFLIRKIGTIRIVGKIVETEAYLPFGDPASHSFRGQTKRNASMFKTAGHAYVYRMRQHCLFNVVTEGQDIPGGVLIRAIEPFQISPDDVPLPRNLTNGPGKLCKALQITHEMDGVLLTDTTCGLYIAQDPWAVPYVTTTATRIGVSKAKEMHLRFYIADNPSVSKR